MIFVKTKSSINGCKDMNLFRGILIVNNRVKQEIIKKDDYES